jgi:hypothetical protein
VKKRRQKENRRRSQNKDKSRGKILPVIEHHTMKTYEGVEVYSREFLRSGRDGGEWLASHAGRFIPRKRDPDIHWIRGWVRLRGDLDAAEERQICPCREWNRDPPVLKLVTILTELCLLRNKRRGNCLHEVRKNGEE